MRAAAPSHLPVSLPHVPPGVMYSNKPLRRLTRTLHFAYEGHNPTRTGQRARTQLQGVQAQCRQERALHSFPGSGILGLVPPHTIWMNQLEAPAHDKVKSRSPALLPGPQASPRPLPPNPAAAAQLPAPGTAAKTVRLFVPAWCGTGIAATQLGTPLSCSTTGTVCFC